MPSTATSASRCCATSISRKCSRQSPGHRRSGDWLKAIRGLLRSAVPTMLRDDPTEGIASIKSQRPRGITLGPMRRSSNIARYWPLGTQQRLVMEFALETASRRGEVVRLGPQHVRNGRIRIERTHGSEDVDMPMSPELQAACDAMPKVASDLHHHRLRQAALEIRSRQ